MVRAVSTRLNLDPSAGGASGRYQRVQALAAGVPPAVEPALTAKRFVQCVVQSSRPADTAPAFLAWQKARRPDPGGKMPPSTAGETPAATWWECPDAPSAARGG